MKNQLSNLPEWPSMLVSDEGQWTQVYCQHDTYARLVAAELIRVLLLMFSLLGWLFCFAHPQPLGFLALTAITGFLIYEKSPLIICMQLFPMETNVIFELSRITINGVAYDISPKVDAQFRAGAKFLDERREQHVRRLDRGGKMSAMCLHKVRYRKVEMVYGGNIVPIAVVSDEDRAAQLAYALQEAWHASRVFHSKHEQRSHTDVLE
jgi:hypothetical protein